jgi:hypothetical protein
LFLPTIVAIARLERCHACPITESFHYFAPQDSFCLQLIVLRAKESQVRDIVGPAARHGFDVVDVQTDGLVASLAVGADVGAPPAVACEHGVAGAQWNRNAIGGVTRARVRVLASQMPFCRLVSTDEVFDESDKHRFEGQLGELVGQERSRGPVLRHERLIGEELDVHLGLGHN